MAKVVLDDVVKRYGPVVAVDHVSLEVEDEEFVAFLGPSGCGKTSTMRMIAGLEDISDGNIYIGETRVNDFSPADRNVAMAFENYGLYPHMTVFNNIAYPLRIREVSREIIGQEVVKLARMLDIVPELDRKPNELNRGVQQRVSLARALARNPSVFLLDEPLSHLDAELRSYMRGELKRLHEMNKSTTIYVTHDQLEAMTMADRVVVMSEGVFQQVGTPQEIFYHPANRFVASFIGEPPMNILRGKVQRTDGGAEVMVGGHVFLDVTPLRAAELLDAVSNDDFLIDVGVRPRDFILKRPGSPGLPARIRLREFGGEKVLLTVDAESGDRLRLEMPHDVGVSEGEQVVLWPDRLDRVHFFLVTSGKAVATPYSVLEPAY